MGVKGTQWGTKEPYREQRNPMGSPEGPENPMGDQGTQWGPKEPNGGQWNPIGDKGTQWGT